MTFSVWLHIIVLIKTVTCYLTYYYLQYNYLYLLFYIFLIMITFNCKGNLQVRLRRRHVSVSLKG